MQGLDRDCRLITSHSGLVRDSNATDGVVGDGGDDPRAVGAVGVGVGRGVEAGGRVVQGLTVFHHRVADVRCLKERRPKILLCDGM